MRHGARFELRETAPNGALQILVNGHALPSVKSAIYEPKGPRDIDIFTVVFNVGELIFTKYGQRPPQSWLDQRAKEAHETVHEGFAFARVAVNGRYKDAMYDAGLYMFANEVELETYERLRFGSTMNPPISSSRERLDAFIDAHD